MAQGLQNLSISGSCGIAMESGRARQCFSTFGGVFFARLSADFRTYIYVCMSCAKVLHKHIYEEGENFWRARNCG